MKFAFLFFVILAPTLNAFAEELAPGVTIDAEGNLTFVPFAENVPGGINTQMKYDDRCREVLATSSKISPSLTELSNSADELDTQVKIITDSNEKDLAFRIQLQATANASAQSILFELQNLEKQNPTLASRITQACEFNRLTTPLPWSETLNLFLQFGESNPEPAP